MNEVASILSHAQLRFWKCSNGSGGKCRKYDDIVTLRLDFEEAGRELTQPLKERICTLYDAMETCPAARENGCNNLSSLYDLTSAIEGAK